MAETEAQFQGRVVDALRALGYVVLVSSARRFRPSSFETVADVVDGRIVERKVGKGYGADRGIPDLLIRDPRWPVGQLFGAELKGVKTAVSADQKELEAMGTYRIYRSGPESVALLDDLAALSPDRASRLMAYKESLRGRGL